MQDKRLRWRRRATRPSVVDVHAALVTDAGARGPFTRLDAKGRAAVDARLQTLTRTLMMTRAAADATYVPKGQGVRVRTQPTSEIGDTLGEHTLKVDKAMFGMQNRNGMWGLKCPGTMKCDGVAMVGRHFPFLGPKSNAPDPDVCATNPGKECCPGVKSKSRGGWLAFGNFCFFGRPGSHGHNDTFLIQGMPKVVNKSLLAISRKANGKFCAPNKDGVVQCDREERYDFEAATLRDGSTVLTAADGKVCSDLSGGVVCKVGDVGPTRHVRVHVKDDGTATLQGGRTAHWEPCSHVETYGIARLVCRPPQAAGVGRPPPSDQDPAPTNVGAPPAREGIKKRRRGTTEKKGEESG